jgi:hypothetical protein
MILEVDSDEAPVTPYRIPVVRYGDHIPESVAWAAYERLLLEETPVTNTPH